MLVLHMEWSHVGPILWKKFPDSKGNWTSGGDLVRSVKRVKINYNVIMGFIIVSVDLFPDCFKNIHGTDTTWIYKILKLVFTSFTLSTLNAWFENTNGSISTAFFVDWRSSIGIYEVLTSFEKYPANFMGYTSHFPIIAIPEAISLSFF